MWKRLVQIIIFLLWVAGAHTQSKIDSLNRLIAKATSDTQRINLEIEKIRTISNTDIDSSIALGIKTIGKAKSINYKKGEANARRNLAFDYCLKGDYPIAKENLDIAFGLRSIDMDSVSLAKIYSTYGVMYSMQNKFDTAIVYYDKSIALLEHLPDKLSLSTTYQNTAIAYQQQSGYPQAISYYQKALSIDEQANDEEGIAYIQLNMAITLRLIGDTARSEQSFLKAINLAEKLNLKIVAAYAYSNLSSLYGDMKKFREQYDFGMKAARLAKELGDWGIEASSLSRAAGAQAKLGNFKDAEKLGHESINIADSSKQPLNIYQSYAGMGFVLTVQEEYKKAIPYYEKAFRVLGESNLYDFQIAESYQSLSACYEKTGNNIKALTAFKTYSRITDSLRNKENIKKSTELTLNSEFEKKQQAVKADQDRKDAVAATKQSALIGGLILMLILAGVALYAYRIKQKANGLLQKQKEEIQSTLSELKSAQAQLIQSEKMASLGELTAGIAHEIQNPLNFVNNFSEINSELLLELQHQQSRVKNGEGGYVEEELLLDIIENEKKINHHGKRADAIVKGMLQHSQSNSGKKEPTDINELAAEYLRICYHGLRAKDHLFSVPVKTDFDITIGKIKLIPQDIGRVLLNLYSNAFYAVAAFAKVSANREYQPAVQVRTKKLGDKISITVRDNGGGIPSAIISKIFQPFFTTKPTGQGTGLGLSLSYDIIKAAGGTMNVESVEGEYAEFTIILPF